MSNASGDRKFRMAMPVITLPPRYGGKRAIVFFSVADPKQPTIQFSTCMDIDGGIHQNVPMSVLELRMAAAKPCHFMQVEGPEGPEAKPLLVGGNS